MNLTPISKPNCYHIRIIRYPVLKHNYLRQAKDRGFIKQLCEWREVSTDALRLLYRESMHIHHISTFDEWLYAAIEKGYIKSVEGEDV